MFRPRVIPVLLLKGKGLVKTVRFKNPVYIGDPVNATRIFNEKRADELVFLDIDATREGRSIPFDLVEKLSDECYMPFSVGGGIRTASDVKRLIQAGAEKIIVNTAATESPDFVTEAANIVGSQSVVVSIDVRRKIFGNYEVYARAGKVATGKEPVEFAQLMQEKGAGEIFLNSIDRDGTYSGYDLELIQKVASNVDIPVIACGGAGSYDDLKLAVKNSKVSAVAAGSIFVFHGKHKAVLINYPSDNELRSLLE